MTSIDHKTLEQKAQEYLNFLCLELDNRRTGSPQNQMAVDFVASKLKTLGFELDESCFECLDWHSGQVSLIVNGEAVEARISPYSNSIEIEAPLVHIKSLEDLQRSDLRGKIGLLTGELAKEQLMPKNFPFYNPQHHQQIIAALEAQAPAALIAATGKNPDLAGGLYPFPLFEDGDFDIPSVYIKDSSGERLASLTGASARLEIEAERMPATACNVIARKGTSSSPRMVICAHIDAKHGTPGALDNAAGVVTLLMLAERLHDYAGELAVELVAFNGEDYYAASGEIEYLRSSLGSAQDVLLAINIDGAGYKEGQSAYSLYGCPEHLRDTLLKVFSGCPDLVEGPEWYQSDHSLFIQQGIPALAFTSDQFDALWSEIAHTPEDRPELVSSRKLVSLSAALHDIILNVDSVAWWHRK